MGKRHHTRTVNFLAALRTMTSPRLGLARNVVATTPVLLALAASACATSRPPDMAGRWVGTVKPISGTCDPVSQAVLTIEGGTKPPYAAIFAPTGGVLVLHGSSDGVSQVAADLHTTGMNHQPYALAFSGTRNGNLITGSYITQRCRSDVELQRK